MSSRLLQAKSEFFLLKILQSTNQNQIVKKSKSKVTNLSIKVTQLVFSAKECNKSFPKNWKLTLHMKRVLGEKTFVCNICNYKFLENYELIASISIIAKHKKYLSWLSRRAPIHIESVHEGNKPYFNITKI